MAAAKKRKAAAKHASAAPVETAQDDVAAPSADHVTTESAEEENVSDSAAAVSPGQGAAGSAAAQDADVEMAEAAQEDEAAGDNAVESNAAMDETDDQAGVGDANDADQLDEAGASGEVDEEGSKGEADGDAAEADGDEAEHEENQDASDDDDNGDDDDGDGDENADFTVKRETEKDTATRLEDGGSTASGSAAVLRGSGSAPEGGSSQRESKAAPDSVMERLQACEFLGQRRRAVDAIRLNRFAIPQWKVLLGDTGTMPLGHARRVYEAFLEVFPASPAIWRAYAERETREGNFKSALEVLGRCLDSYPAVSLWALRVELEQQDAAGKPDARDRISAVFGQALDAVGTEFTADKLWRDFILFLEQENVAGNFEESQRMTRVRKAYQRAVVMPTQNVMSLWKSYEHFEMMQNKQLAKGLLAEYRPASVSASALARERRALMERLQINDLSAPLTGSKIERTQMELWKKYIALERANSQQVAPTEFCKRVCLAFQNALYNLRYSSELWYEYASFLIQQNMNTEAGRVFDEACAFMPSNQLLHFLAADFFERQRNLERSTQIYEKLCSEVGSDHAFIQFQRFARRQYGVSEARQVFRQARKSQYTTSRMFLFSALMELRVNKEPKVARNVYELGLKRFLHEAEYVMAYADFLESQNDISNLRSLYEKALGVIPRAQSLPLWDRYVELEYRMATDIATVEKLERRRAAVHPNTRSANLLSTVMRRYLHGEPSSALLSAEEASMFTESEGDFSFDPRAKKESSSRKRRDGADDKGAEKKRKAPLPSEIAERAGIKLPPLVALFLDRLPPAKQYTVVEWRMIGFPKEY